MKKLLAVLTVLLLCGCATLPTGPTADPGDFVKWCWVGLDTSNDYVAVAHDEECPEGSMVYSMEMTVDFYLDVMEYIDELKEGYWNLRRIGICKPDKIGVDRE